MVGESEQESAAQTPAWENSTRHHVTASIRQAPAEPWPLLLTATTGRHWPHWDRKNSNIAQIMDLTLEKISHLKPDVSFRLKEQRSQSKPYQ